ncbi:MAG: hypothetical protein M3R22_00185 [Pseudomonadota bacterium]|nr:hypothetical protein [Pseudomonadota bacterium]
MASRWTTLPCGLRASRVVLSKLKVVGRFLTIVLRQHDGQRLDLWKYPIDWVPN